MATFVVQYDVELEDIIGDRQMRGPAEWKVGSGVRQSWETRRWPPRGTWLFLPGNQRGLVHTDKMVCSNT